MSFEPVDLPLAHLSAYVPSSDVPKGLRPVHVYCDESSIQGSRFMGFGGIWLTPEREANLRAEIADVVVHAGWKPGTEFKWTKVSGGVASKGLAAYRALVDRFFSLPDCRFRCIMVDRHDDWRQEGDDELSFYKDAHWLLRKRFVPGCKYVVVLDKRNNRQADRLPELHQVLNNAVRMDHGHGHDAFREVRPADSKREPILQLADVLLGAVCYHFNGNHLVEGASGSKIALSQHIAEAGGYHDRIIRGRSVPHRKFCVWHFRPTAAARNARRRPTV